MNLQKTILWMLFAFSIGILNWHTYKDDIHQQIFWATLAICAIIMAIGWVLQDEIRRIK